MTATDTDHAANIVRDLARQTTAPVEVHPGSIYIVHSPDGFKTVDLTGDEYREFPERKIGTVVVRDAAGFCHYFGKHGGDTSEVYGDIDMATVTAVLDAHASDAPRWQDHRLILRLQQTMQWRTWLGANGQMMSQQAFAEFVEEHAADVAPDGPVDSATLLEVAQHFHAATSVQFEQGERLVSGETRFTYLETVEAKAGKRVDIVIPTEFQLGIAPYEDCGAWRVNARFRYRLNNGKLTLGYKLDDPARKAQEAVKQVIGKIADELGVTVILGEPS